MKVVLYLEPSNLYFLEISVIICFATTILMGAEIAQSI
jgi:hypothetical protein